MSELYVFETRAYPDEETLLERTGAAPDQAIVHRYQGDTPQDLWRIDGGSGTMVTDDFKNAVGAFKMGGVTMTRIDMALILTETDD